LHAAIEMKWRAIVSFHFTRTYVHEVNHLEPLLESLWDIGNVLADSGYLSRENCRLIYRKGGTPYIRPKKIQQEMDGMENVMFTGILSLRWLNSIKRTRRNG